MKPVKRLFKKSGGAQPPFTTLLCAAAGGVASGFLLASSFGPPSSPATNDDGICDITEAEAKHATWLAGRLEPTQRYVKVSERFLAEFDPATRNPRWVIERFSMASAREGGAAVGVVTPNVTSEGTPNIRRGHSFKEDASVPYHLRARLGDFRGSQLDRGHLAAAADMRGCGDEERAVADSFSLCNVSPQDPSFNRDYWARVEKFVRGLSSHPSLLAQKASDVFVCTGPLFLPKLAAAPAVPPSSRVKKTAPILAATSGAKKTLAISGGSIPPESSDIGYTGSDSAPSWAYAHRALGSASRWLAVPTHFYKVTHMSKRSR